MGVLKRRGLIMRSRILCLAVVAAMTTTAFSSTARADLSGENAVRDGGIKGAIGLGLLGVDLTLISEGARGVRSPWLLTLIPLVVGAGGAVGGYYMGRESVEGSVATLIAGIALLIPAAILVAHGRAYRADRSEEEGFIDRTEEGRPADDGFDDDLEDPSTETEVIGPEESDSISSPGPAAIISPPLPVGGMLRLVAEASYEGSALRLGFNFF